mgnify:CR=1 FL=1
MKPLRDERVHHEDKRLERRAHQRRAVDGVKAQLPVLFGFVVQVVFLLFVFILENAQQKKHPPFDGCSSFIVFSSYLLTT